MQNNLSFNPKPSTILHVDLNSCFATIEQQANPHLRGKPIAVAAYDSPRGCIVAPSVEAKRFGVKVGMRVMDGKLLCRELIVLTPDPAKYRMVHLALRKVISTYTDDFYPKSIDEFVLNMEGYPAFTRGMHTVAKELKERIKREIGEAITVSVGIAPNRFLAKLAAGLHKPDGLDEINVGNFHEIYSRLSLLDLHGIKTKNTVRLNNAGVFTVLDFYRAPLHQLNSAFQSILSYYWYLRLRGWEIDDVEFGRHSYGNSYSLPFNASAPHELSPILAKLVEKMGARVRRAGYAAQGVHVGILYREGGFWHKGVTLPKVIFDSRDIYKKAFRILLMCPYHKPVHTLAVSVFNLKKEKSLQLDFFEDVPKKKQLVAAVDKVNERWGNFVITPARMINTTGYVPDRIAFGGVKELEEIMMN
jgi:DNA polymerase-4